MKTQSKAMLGALPLVIPEKTQFLPENMTFLLGADDKEMRRIEELLIAFKIAFMFATHKGKRAHSGNAYEADPVTLVPGRILVFVECDTIELLGDAGLFRRIDHHRDTDEGYHLGPKFYWKASSLGQLYELINRSRATNDQVVPTKDDLIIAARDHCLFAAMQGRCPGITSDEVHTFGVTSIAEELGVPVIKVKERMEELTQKIDTAPRVTIGDQEAIDLRGSPTGIAYSLDDLIAKQLFASRGQAGLIRCKNSPEDPDKVMMCGATPKAIHEFRTTWGPKEGLQSFFFVESRQYIGGFSK